MQVPNILTPKDCKAIITSVEAKGIYHQTQLNNLGSYGGAIFVVNNEYRKSYPPLCLPHTWSAPWTKEVHFTRTNGIYKADDQLYDLYRLLWTPGLKAAFEGIALKRLQRCAHTWCQMCDNTQVLVDITNFKGWCISGNDFVRFIRSGAKCTILSCRY